MKFSKQLLPQVHYQKTLVFCILNTILVFTGRIKPKPTSHVHTWHLGGRWHGWAGLTTCTLTDYLKNHTFYFV